MPFTGAEIIGRTFIIIIKLSKIILISQLAYETCTEVTKLESMNTTVNYYIIRFSLNLL